MTSLWKTRTYCGKLKEDLVDKETSLVGWVDTIRDHGHLLFIHIRDISGICQLVFNPETSPEVYKVAQSLKSEFVISVKGKIERRSDDTINPNIATGAIEVLVESITILSESTPPPFMISEKDILEDGQQHVVDEDLRLKYRYLDLRRPSMQQKTNHEIQKLSDNSILPNE